MQIIIFTADNFVARFFRRETKVQEKIDCVYVSSKNVEIFVDKLFHFTTKFLEKNPLCLSAVCIALFCASLVDHCQLSKPQKDK